MEQATGVFIVVTWGDFTHPAFRQFGRRQESFLFAWPSWLRAYLTTRAAALLWSSCHGT
jgi:cytochrome c biogenesis protein CcdA